MPGGFVDGWKKFVLYNWNSPPVIYYRKWDKLFPGALPEGRAVQTIALGHLSQKTVSVRAGMQHLAASYNSYEFKKDVRLVEYHNALAASPNADVQAIVTLADGTGERRTGRPPPRGSSAADKPEEDITDLVLIVSNHSRSAGSP